MSNPRSSAKSDADFFYRYLVFATNIKSEENAVSDESKEHLKWIELRGRTRIHSKGTLFDLSFWMHLLRENLKTRNTQMKVAAAEYTVVSIFEYTLLFGDYSAN